MPKKRLPPPPPSTPDYSEVVDPQDIGPAIDMSELDAAFKKEAKYGDRPVEAFVRGAADTASFGLAPGIERAITGDIERMQSVPELNPGATTAGEVAGVVVPALATLGTSTPAQVLGSGVKALSAMGTAAEKATAKALAAKLGGTAANITGKVAGGALEGGVIGAGQLASAVAKEDEQLSAESLAAHIGMGAGLGGGFSLLHGLGNASIPKLKSIGASAVKGSKNLTDAALENIIDPTEAILSSISRADFDRLSTRRNLGEKGLANLERFVKDELEFSVGSTPRSLFNKNEQVIETSGAKIGEISKQLDELVNNGTITVSRQEAYTPIVNRFRQAMDDLGTGGLEVLAPKRKMIQKFINDAVRDAESTAPFSFKDFNNLRKEMQDLTYGAVGKKEGRMADLADIQRGEARDVIDNIALKASEKVPGLANELRDANSSYHLASTLKKPLEKTMNAQKSILDPITLSYDTTARLARNAAVVYDVAEKVTAVKSAIGKSLETFFAPRPSAKSLPSSLASTQILMASDLSKNTETGKPAKNKGEAFTNLQKNVSEVATDPDKLIDLLAKKTARVSSADPVIGSQLQETVANAVQFLNSKLPKPSVQSGLFQRPYQPTSMEMAKLERYMQVIEKPLTVLKELEQGTLTREHVEALKAVYPAIYKQIQFASIEHISQNPQLAYAKKVQISILLDVPADASLSGESVMQLQQSITSTEEQAEPGQSQPSQGGNASAKPTMTGLKGIDLAGREASGVQKLQADVP